MLRPDCQTPLGSEVPLSGIEAKPTEMAQVRWCTLGRRNGRWKRDCTQDNWG